MLVLSRKLGEAIHIDGGITLKVVEVRGNRVRLAIEAPRSTHIQRAELTPRSNSLRHADVAVGELVLA